MNGLLSNDNANYHLQWEVQNTIIREYWKRETERGEGRQERKERKSDVHVSHLQCWADVAPNLE